MTLTDHELGPHFFQIAAQPLDCARAQGHVAVFLPLPLAHQERAVLKIDVAELERFPEDFMFRLTRSEIEALNLSQIATGSQKHRDPRFPPFAFTEHGAIQAANVLNSPKAVEMGIYVVRAFVRLRELLASNTALARKLDALERKYKHHDEAITAILSAIRELTNPPAPKRRSIGFTADLE